MTHLIIGSDLFKPSIGGTETVTENMAKNLSKMGYRVTVIAPAQKGQSSPRVANDSGGYKILRVKSIGIPIQKNVRVAWGAYGQISTFLSHTENTPDVIHTNNPFPLSWALLRYARKNSIPIIVGSHYMPESFTVGLRRFGNLHNVIDNFGWKRAVKFYNKADAIIAPTKTAIQYLKSNGLIVPSYVISNGIDLQLNKKINISKSKLKTDLGLQAKYTIVYAGRIGVEKQIDVIITALYILLQRQDIDVQLVLIGDGNAVKKLKKLTRRLKLEKRVVFTGYIGDSTLKHKYFRACDVFAIASPVELQSIVTLEAMAAGLPIFGVNEGALPELAQAGVNGDTFEDGDSAGLARIIGNVLLDPVKLHQYSQASLKIVKHHNINDTWVKYCNMYQEVLSSKK